MSEVPGTTRDALDIIVERDGETLVLIDTEMLSTLPERSFLSGLAEVIKYGVIDDAEFFAWLERSGAAVCAGDRAAQIRAVCASCAAKAFISSASAASAQICSCCIRS